MSETTPLGGAGRAIDNAVDEIRDVVAADGGKLEMVGLAGKELTLRLVLEDAHCIECVMPRGFLELIAVDAMNRHGAPVTVVRIHDPREG